MDQSTINSASAAINNMSTIAATGKMNKATRKWNEEQRDLQRAWAIADRDYANNYNSPAQQMARLKEAGLNPHLIYGSGSATETAAPIADAKAPDWNPRMPDMNAMLQGPANMYMETRTFQAQQRLMDAQTVKTLAEVDTKQFTLSQQQRLADTQATILDEIAVGKSLTNQLTRDENVRRNAMTSSNIQEALSRMAKTMSDIDLQDVMKQKGNEDIKTAQQARVFVARQIENAAKDGLIKQFEIEMNKDGITKGDPYYVRMLDKFLNWIISGNKAGNTGPKKVDPNPVPDLIQGWKKIFPNAGKVRW